MLRIRPATAGDLETLVELETAPDTAENLGVTGLAYHERAFADPDQEQIVAQFDDARAGGPIVGFVVLAGLREGGGRVELRRIVLCRGRRGEGHGRSLFRAAVARAYRLHGASDLWLDVKPGNARGRALYESEGLVRTGTVPDPTDPDGVLLLMAYRARPALADEYEPESTR
jgi:GNAT superfamily N-acetyltransferase